MSVSTANSLTDRITYWIVRCLAILLIFLLSACGVLWFVMIVVEPADRFFGQLIGSGFLATIYCGQLLCAGIIFRKRTLQPLMIVAAAVVPVTLWIWLSVMWDRYDRRAVEMLLMQVAGIGTIFTLTSVLSGFLMLMRTNDALSRWLRLAYLAMAWCVALFGMLLLFDEWMVFRWLGGLTLPLLAVGVLAVTLGMTCIPIIISARNRRQSTMRETLAEQLSITLSCPKCHVEQTLTTGPTRCGSCATLMNIELEEPRCDCGYTLYRLPTPSCPECGRVIPDKKRWVDPTPAAEPLAVAHST